MASKADFNAEEWELLVSGPAIAGLMAVAAGRGGTVRESLAVGETYAEARAQQAGPPLVDELIASPPQLDHRSFAGPEDLQAKGPERLRAAASLIDERGSAEEAEAYKRFALDVAQHAAERHKEGGFLGVGGKRVSDEEAAALAEIAAALDIPYPPPDTSAG